MRWFKVRKQTKKWTTKDGEKIRICDMQDDHLSNSINLLERVAKHMEMESISAGYQMLCMLQGEMAIDSVERELMVLEEHGIDPNQVNELYDNLIDERERRKAMEEKDTTRDMENTVEEKSTWEFYIAGVQHHEIHKVMDKLETGKILTLTPEPTNKYDSNAVRIEHVSATQYDGDTRIMIGYVPAKISGQVSEALMRAGKITSCKITEVNADEKPWKQCKVLITKED